MNKSNNTGILENFVNTVMGVKTLNQQRSSNTFIATTQELDVRAVLVYTLGTILQILVMILVLLVMEKLVILIDKNSFTFECVPIVSF